MARPAGLVGRAVLQDYLVLAAGELPEVAVPALVARLAGLVGRVALPAVLLVDLDLAALVRVVWEEVLPAVEAREGAAPVSVALPVLPAALLVDLAVLVRGEPREEPTAPSRPYSGGQSRPSPSRTCACSW